MAVFDVAIVGGGPAGLSAALTARVHNKSVVLFEAAGFGDKLRRASKINNIPGIMTISGIDFMENLLEQTLSYEPVIVKERVQSVFIGEPFTLMTADNVFQAKSVILATGVAMSKTVPGERALLGRGVSYCASCDSHFFEDKDIAVYINTLAYQQDVELLASLAKNMNLYIGGALQLPREWLDTLPASVVVHKKAIVQSVEGEKTVTAIHTNEGMKIVDGVFFLRDTYPPENLVEGVILDGNSVAVNRHMETNFKGLFAAGDVVGTPLQVAKAVGEGQMAAFSAVAYAAGY